MSERTRHEPEPDEKIVGDITHGAWANPDLKEILKHFGKKAFARSSACMEFESFIRRLQLRGKVALEIGTFYGITAIVLARYFERVICVSMDVDGARQQKYDFAKHLGLQDRIRFFDIADNQEKADLIQQLDFDFCYSDGDHAHDARTDFQLAQPCGRVLFHEYWPIQAAVWNLVNGLAPSEVTRADHDCFAYWQRTGWTP